MLHVKEFFQGSRSFSLKEHVERVKFYFNFDESTPAKKCFGLEKYILIHISDWLAINLRNLEKVSLVEVKTDPYKIFPRDF